MTFADIESRFEAIRSNKLFETFIISIIVFSALVVGVKTYSIPETVTKVVSVLDWFITVVFLIEISIRFIAEKTKHVFFTVVGICSIPSLCW